MPCSDGEYWDNPDWIFYRRDGPTEADVVPRLMRSLRDFDRAGRSTSNSGTGNLAGNYNDIYQFVYFIVRDLHPSGNTEEVHHAFDLMGNWLKNGNQRLRERIVIGCFEDLQNFRSRQAFR